MCGITGIISKLKINDLAQRIEKMNSSILHRGPDANGVFMHEEKIALGHRRLSIIDISQQANQPMISNNGRWNIVFNGEIYNFIEIKKSLQYNFFTHSDTEVILAAIQEKGIDWFLEHANGMFAIALFDRKTGISYLIRDRLGIKPLYYYQDSNKVIFSSEIKAILSSGLIEPIFNKDAIDEYLANRYVRSPFTFFKNIFQVEAGEIITIKENIDIDKRKYWELPQEFNTNEEYDEEKISRQFEEELIKAIEYRLIADVPLGTYLSGGVDSSFITAITAIKKGNTVNSYTIGFPELNEFKYSELIANKYNTSHHEIEINIDDYIKNWERLIKYKDAPLGVPNEIPLAVMSEKLKEKITVVLSGEGADELMGGYGRIFRAPFDYKNSQEAKKSFYDFFIEKYEYVPRKLRDEYLSSPAKYRELFDSKIKNEFSKRNNEENVFRFFHDYHVKGLLQRVDMTTMQTSVEARVPFLDHKLIEFSYKEIPYLLKLKWRNKESELKAKKMTSDKYSEVLDIPKYLLRKISYKYLPKEIIERKKVGFPVPLSSWFNNLEDIATNILSEADWLNTEKLEDLILQSRKELRAGQILWMFINVELFKRNYFNRSWKW